MSEDDPNSLLNYTRCLLELRNKYPALGNNAAWRLINGLETPYPMVYERTDGVQKCVVVINPTSKALTTTVPYTGQIPEVVGGSYTRQSYKGNAKKEVDIITISPVSAVIYKY